jgi:transcriptional regulator with XRE-family HTH domain
MKLGKLVAAWRRENKLTVEELARQIGVDRLVLWRLEQGKYEHCKHWPAILHWVFDK